jgi:hypothetical protein
MFEGSQMADEPEYESLEALFAADEASIRDEGFSARVMTGVKPARRGLRRAVIGAAGALGMGVAGFSVSSALKFLPPTEPKAPINWLDPLGGGGAQALTDMATSPMVLLGLVVALAALVSLAAAALQEN